MSTTRTRPGKLLLFAAALLALSLVSATTPEVSQETGSNTPSPTHILWLPLLQANAARPPGVIALENDRLRLEFERQDAGQQTWGLALRRATVKASSYSFGFDPGDLWRITLRATDGTTTTLAPSTASYTLSIRTSTTQTLIAVWDNIAPTGSDSATAQPSPIARHPAPMSDPGLTVTATVTLTPDAPYALWTIAVDNRHPDRAVYYVDFPRLRVRPVGAPDTNRAVVPYLGGRLITDPLNSVALKTLLLPLPYFFLYPHMYTPLQLFTYYDTAGDHVLYLAAHDGAGYTKAFDFRADGQRLYFGVRQYPESNTTPGNDYSAPYPVAIGALPGDWYDAAKQYRAWALEQPWGQRGPIALSDDFSTKLKGSDIMGVWAPFPGATKPFEAAAQDMARWRDFLEIEHVSGLWYGWHGNEFDTGWPEYEPVEPSFADGMTLTHRLDNYAWPYINPMGWDIATASYTTTHAADYALKDEWGNVQVVTSTKGAVFALMDPATPFWQEYVRDWVLTLQGDYDVDGIYLDVWSGSGYGFDYDPSHGHPTGGGNYIAQGMRAQGRMIREATRASDPGFIMMSEHPGELFIDLLEIENVEYVGPLNPAQWWVVPLFNAVYHDYIAMSTFVNTSAKVPDSPENEAALSWMWAVRYTQGNLLAVNGDGAAVLRDPVETTPNFGAYRFLRTLVQSYTYAAPYLRYGERLRDLPVEVPTRLPPSPNGVPFQIAPYALEQPMVLSSVWRSVTDDSIGLVFTNWVTTTQTITYTFDPARYGLPDVPLGLYRLDASGGRLVTSFQGSLTRAETLPGRSLLVLMIAPRADRPTRERQ